MKKFVLAALMLSLAGIAHAGPLTAGSTPASNNVLGIVQGYFGGAVYIVGAGPGGVSATFDFIGKEAGFTNTFFYDDLTNNANDVNFTTNGFADASAPGGYPNPFHAALATKTVTVYNGLMNFSFTSPLGTVVNGANGIPQTNQVNFFATFNLPGNPTSGQTIWLALDDLGAGPDDNHDDMVVRVTLNQGSFSVPDGGATLSLLGSALMGLGLLRRKLRA